MLSAMKITLPCSLVKRECRADVRDRTAAVSMRSTSASLSILPTRRSIDIASSVRLRETSHRGLSGIRSRATKKSVAGRAGA
jgi:hypothetical protein